MDSSHGYSAHMADIQGNRSVNQSPRQGSAPSVKKPIARRDNVGLYPFGACN